MVSAKCVLARHAVSLPEGQLQQFRQDEPLDLSTDCSLKQDSARSQKAGQPLRTHPTCDSRGQLRSDIRDGESDVHWCPGHIPAQCFAVESQRPREREVSPDEGIHPGAAALEIKPSCFRHDRLDLVRRETGPCTGFGRLHDHPAFKITSPNRLRPATHIHRPEALNVADFCWALGPMLTKLPSTVPHWRQTDRSDECTCRPAHPRRGRSAP